MLDQLKELEVIARQLDPGIQTRTDWTETVTKYADQFLDNIENTPAYSDEGDPLLIDKTEFGEEGKSLEDLIHVLRDGVDTQGINPASGGHVGYIPGGGLYPSALADYMADVTNRYAGIYFANPGAVRMENKLIRWMNDMIGYPDRAHGNLASGGSIANLTAITAARDAKQIDSRNVRSSVIYLNPQTHHCVHKAVRIAGLAECTLREVPLDNRYRMSASALREMINDDISNGLNPFLVVGSLGSTDTGAVDPIASIADVAEEFDLWFHVDAAYGGFFILVDELKHHFKGIERSDSFVIDPHKGMFLPYGLGAVLVRDANHLHRSHYYQANYMQDAAENAQQLSPADLSPELTKHFRGLRMWLPMQLYGLAPFRAALKEKWLLARHFHLEIRKLGFVTGPEPDLSVVIYRYPAEQNANELNLLIVRLLREDGRIFVSSTTIDGVVWLRLAVLSFRTHLKEIDILLDMLQSALHKSLSFNSLEN